MTVRPATTDDIAAILAIWNPVIRDTAFTFTSTEKIALDLAAMMAARRAAGQAFLVAEAGGAVLGFATYGQFRGGDGYAHSMEHTIILAAGARGRGLGRALMAELEDHAGRGGAHTLLAGVSAENPAGVAFHAALGFSTLARLPEVGRKFGRWLDLVLMQKML